MTQIILQEDVEDLGAAGEVVDVKPGYARNYLLPQGLAIRATEGGLRQIREERRRKEHAAEQQREAARELADRFEGLSLTFEVLAAEEGKLFGSVSVQDIQEQLAGQGIELDQDQILIEEPIRELGVYSVGVDLHTGVQPSVKVWVVAEE